MEDSESKFRNWLSNLMPIFCKRYSGFEGNVRGLADFDKDFVCKSFIDCFPSWIDDLVPPCTTDQRGYLDGVYSDLESEFLFEIRGDIYNHLESKLDELMLEVWAEYSNIKPEPFPGYEVGQ